VRVGGWICAIFLPKRWHGCTNVGFGPNFTNYFVQIGLGLNHTRQRKKGGWKFVAKGLSAWACLLGKNGAFLQTLITHFLATI